MRWEGKCLRKLSSGEVKLFLFQLKSLSKSDAVTQQVNNSTPTRCVVGIRWVCKGLFSLFSHAYEHIMSEITKHKLGLICEDSLLNGMIKSLYFCFPGVLRL